MSALTVCWQITKPSKKRCKHLSQKQKKKLSAFAEDTARVEQFLELARKYTDFSELTTPMINEFIEKIIVHAPERIDGDRVQEVEIHLRFIGQFELPAPELTEEESKRQEQLKRHRIKSRERYQKNQGRGTRCRSAFHADL